LLDAVAKRERTDFCFPPLGSIEELSVEEISPLLPLFQKQRKTSPWAMTWPHETAYWVSDAGREFLAASVARRRLDQASTYRVGVCPFALGVSSALCDAFLEVMDVQAQLGIGIGMVDPGSLSRIVDGDAKGVIAYGDRVGLYVHNIYAGVDVERVAIRLDDDSIADMRALFKEVWRSSVHWDKYLSRHRIAFSQVQSERMAARVREIRHASERP
jgi:hypothetical protein